ncbi:MAG: ROK family protein [Candidatus Cloacimonetes bacterium]|nr:ROK family protein [Candidatus Cloacimonadota bacterium]
MSEVRNFLGIDIGASAIKYGWGNSVSSLQGFDSIATPNSSKAGIKKAMAEVIARCGQRVKAISGIGIGIPGTLDIGSSRLHGINPNLQCLNDTRLSDLLPEDIRIPYWFENDANLMTFSEAIQYPDARVVIGITLGSGIGSGLVINGGIYRGGCGYAMEIGHIEMVDKGAECNCGRTGCLEAYSSMTGIRRRLQLLGIDAADWDYARILETGKRDASVNLVVTEGLKYLSRGIGILSVILDPDVIVLGGGMTEVADFPWISIKDRIMELTPEQNREHLRLVKAEFGNRSGVRGGILLAEKMLPSCQTPF